MWCSPATASVSILKFSVLKTESFERLWTRLSFGRNERTRTVVDPPDYASLLPDDLKAHADALYDTSPGRREPRLRCAEIVNWLPTPDGIEAVLCDKIPPRGLRFCAEHAKTRGEEPSIVFESVRTSAACPSCGKRPAVEVRRVVDPKTKKRLFEMCASCLRSLARAMTPNVAPDGGGAPK